MLGRVILIFTSIAMSAERYAMIVELSLEKSAKFEFKPRGKFENIRRLSPVDGSLAPLEADNSLWLVPGAGVLLKLRRRRVDNGGLTPRTAGVYSADRLRICGLETTRWANA